MTSQPSTFYFNATIITVNSTRDVLLEGALLVTKNRITAIGKTTSLSSNLPAETKYVDLEGKIVLPGLINAHAHVAQSLMKGLGEDLDLHTWACDAIWPLKASYEGKDGYVAARLALAEMLKSGTTTFLEPMLPSHAGFENVVKAVEVSGIRACLVSVDELLPWSEYADIGKGKIGEICEAEYCSWRVILGCSRQGCRVNVYRGSALGSQAASWESR
jgi:cytosine/adenosine deaminase-related metal-dependent hydrolase